MRTAAEIVGRDANYQAEKKQQEDKHKQTVKATAASPAVKPTAEHKEVMAMLDRLAPEYGGEAATGRPDFRRLQPQPLVKLLLEEDSLDREISEIAKKLDDSTLDADTCSRLRDSTSRNPFMTTRGAI